MSLMSPSYAEKILMKEDREFRKKFKQLLKERIKDGDERAAEVYSEMLPKIEWSTECSMENKYRWRITNRFVKNIPTMIV